MSDFVRAIRHNIACTQQLFENGVPPAVIGTVCGSEGARIFWQRQLDAVRASFKARKAIAFHEDLPVNQAFGLLLLWQRLRHHLEPGEGALIGFVFGEGSRATPLTEAECGQKPAIRSFVRDQNGRFESTVAVALRFFAPVEDFLRRSGFRGVVVKWGDEIQIPTRPLNGTDTLFEHADVVRFVSMQKMTEDLAANKDWVGVDENQHVTAFIPRRPLDEMKPLAQKGLIQERDGALVGGVNLGSIGISHALLDALHSEFEREVNDAQADRKERPDLDPQLFTALTIAAEPDAQTRQRLWDDTLNGSSAIQALNRKMPGILERLRKALDRFEIQQGRPIRIVAMDFEDQFWGDIGQHTAMHTLLTSLTAQNEAGEIARALAGVPEKVDARGNRWVGACQIGPDVDVQNSVLIDAQVRRGRIRDSVLLGTRCDEFHGEHCFDVMSLARSLRLLAGSGAYRVVSPSAEAAPGERITSVFFEDGGTLLRAHQDTPLRDRPSTYDIPIADNPLSFREVHARVTASDPKKIETQRAWAEKEGETWLNIS